jgi:hypothetical protein
MWVDDFFFFEDPFSIFLFPTTNDIIINEGVLKDLGEKIRTNIIQLFIEKIK